ncbi:MAG: ABC transporter permease, partial [Thermoplasmatota archaeon]
GKENDGTGLPRGQVILSDDLAANLEAKAGDTIDIRYTIPIDPVRPVIEEYQGTLTSVGGTLPGLPGLPLQNPTSDSYTRIVQENATELISLLAWESPLPLQLALHGPNGERLDSQAAAPAPLFLRVEDPAPGPWRLEISAPAAVVVPYYAASVALYPAYSFEELSGIQVPEGFAAFGDLLGDTTPREASFTVWAVSDGGRGEQFDFEEAFWIHLDEAQALFEREDEINVIKFSNPGDMVTGRDRTDEAVVILNATLQDIQAKLQDPAVDALFVNPVKRDFIEFADEQGQTLTGLLIFAGSLTVITGLLLIINIFTMLAEERRPELGMARAVGLMRRDLIRLFVYEGSLYAVVAAAIGAVLGLGLAGALVAFINTLIQSFEADFPPIAFVVRFDRVLVAFAVGALLTFATIFFASRRIARLNIVRAIRQIDEPEKTGGAWQIWVGAPLAALSTLLVTAAWVLPLDYKFSMQVFGAVGIVLGLALALRRYVTKKRLYPLLSAALFAYYTVTYFIIGDYDNIQEANIVGPIRGVILTLAVVVILSYFEWGPRALGGLLARLKSMRAVALPAVSYPQHKRFRTGMTLAMFSIVILSIGFFSIFGALFQTPPERQTGGYEIKAYTTLDVEDLSDYDRGLLPDVITAEVHIAEFFNPEPDFITVNGERVGSFGPPGHSIYGVDQSFVDTNGFRLLWKLDQYATDKDAYQAALNGEGVIVSYRYSTGEQNQDLYFEVGDTLRIHQGDDLIEHTILGIQEQFHFNGIWLPKPFVEQTYGAQTDNLFLYKLADGTDATAFAKDLERNYRDVGMDAEDLEEHVKKEQETFDQILSAMKLFLGLGLIIGILSLGIVTSRSVLERRQEIGMLRAIGYTPGMIRRIFITEVTTVVFVGSIVGIACSILVTFGLWFAIIKDLQYPYVIPWLDIGVLLLVSYAFAILATLLPIRRASRTAPAEALRYIE